MKEPLKGTPYEGRGHLEQKLTLQPLSSEQEKARQFVVDTLAKMPSGERGFITILGLPGIGKSYLSQGLQEGLAEKNTLIADADMFSPLSPYFDSDSDKALKERIRDKVLKEAKPL